MNLRRSGGALAAVLLGALAFGACGSDEPPPGAAETGENPTTTAAEATTTVPADEATTTTTAEEEGQADAVPVSEEVTAIDLTATEYAYAGLDAGAEVPAGLVQVNITNDGEEEHQATIVRLHDDTTLDEFAAAGASDPTGAAALALVDGYGGPNSAAPQGGTASATSNLVAGEYLMICFIPAPDGAPHAAHGMLTPFTVTDTPAADTTLADDELAGTITTTEFAFELANRAGDPVDALESGVYRLRNDGAQAHEAAVYELLDGATVDDFLAFDPATATGPPPARPAGGVSAVIGSNSVSSYLDVDLTPGEYVLMCFLPDVSDGGDGAPHFTHGMVLPFSVG
jgi:hypothetical protein